MKTIVVKVSRIVVKIGWIVVNLSVELIEKGFEVKINSALIQIKAVHLVPK